MFSMENDETRKLDAAFKETKSKSPRREAALQRSQKENDAKYVTPPTTLHKVSILRRKFKSNSQTFIWESVDYTDPVPGGT